MCGIIGIFGPGDVSREIAFGLTSLQHRGQDAAGIVSLGRHFHIKKGNGLVSQIFNDQIIDAMQAPIALGHVRYATQGSLGEEHAQPIYMNYPIGLAMVHNGNVINFKELGDNLRKDHRVIETTNDLELILYTFAASLEKENLLNITEESIFNAVRATQNAIKGAYSALTIVANHGLLAFTDPSGIRPLSMGSRQDKAGKSFAFASESSCLESLGYEDIYELKAGEAVFIDKNKIVFKRLIEQRRPAFCIFEHIYFAREDTVMRGRLVADERVKMGKKLARAVRESGIELDVIIDVPSSAYYFASGLAEELGVPYRRGLAKNKYIGRSFLFPTQELRAMAVRQKLSPLRPVIEGRSVGVVDDSIVRGNTSRRLVELLRSGGVREIHFISAAPPVMYPCIYGIDMSVRKELIAAHNAQENIAGIIGADSVIYQSLEDLRSLYNETGFCDACFSGDFPTGISGDLLEEIEKERILAKNDMPDQGRNRL
ncbi:MAG: amidophosphoribosyltransferase [Candidatus Riflebacteria bacterium]